MLAMSINLRSRFGVLPKTGTNLLNLHILHQNMLNLPLLNQGNQGPAQSQSSCPHLLGSVRRRRRRPPPRRGAARPRCFEDEKRKDEANFGNL